MYNKLSATYEKKRALSSEDGPPEKKLISDGDIFIKQLAEKQRSTKINLEQQLSAKSRFYKSTELIPLTNYTSGSKTLQDFSSVIKRADDLETLKSRGLTLDEIELFLAHKNGNEHLREKYKNINGDVLNERLGQLFRKLDAPIAVDKESGPGPSGGRLQTELILSTKPNSLETKLMKFALENRHKNADNIPHPMDEIKQFEKELSVDVTPVDVKKIRRKARALAKQVEGSGERVEAVAVKKLPHCSKNDLLVINSKWDVKECDPTPKSCGSGRKEYSCKPQNHYTIKDGQIIKINEIQSKETASVTGKLTLEEIKQLPKFQNYQKGVPSKTLFLKNLANGVREEDLRQVLDDMSSKALSVRVMRGKMQGQAFIETEDESAAEEILNKCNGVVFKNKPIIIQFGKSKAKS